MPGPRASIVIPTFNRSRMLRRAVDSALAQSVPCEVIVCDHGSTDDTPAVAAGYGDRIRYLRRERDHGPHFAWLDGVLAATSEMVHLNFDDDIVTPDYIARCLGMMADDVAFAFTQASVFDEDTGAVTGLLYEGVGPTGTHPVGRFMDYQIRSLVSPGAMLLRRTDVIDGLFVGRMPFESAAYRGVGPDWIIPALATLKRPRFAFIAEPLAKFSAHQGSITVDALADARRKRAIRAAYQSARFHYYLERLNGGWLGRALLLTGFHAHQLLGRARYGVRRLLQRSRKALTVSKPPA